MPSFNIPDMTCGHCKASVEGAILELDSTAKITIDLDTHNVDVDTQTAADAIVAALKTAGYEATPT
ncbi:MAG: heavy metal-binding protein [Rhodobacteraceae bacterium]|nr:MAG: heavy metal-binding protein [Paracoccaceae bacterium]